MHVGKERPEHPLKLRESLSRRRPSTFSSVHLYRKCACKYNEKGLNIANPFSLAQTLVQEPQFIRSEVVDSNIEYYSNVIWCQSMVQLEEPFFNHDPIKCMENATIFIRLSKKMTNKRHQNFCKRRSQAGKDAPSRFQFIWIRKCHFEVGRTQFLNCIVGRVFKSYRRYVYNVENNSAHNPGIRDTGNDGRGPALPSIEIKYPFTWSKANSSIVLSTSMALPRNNPCHSSFVTVQLKTSETEWPWLSTIQRVWIIPSGATPVRKTVPAITPLSNRRSCGSNFHLNLNYFTFYFSCRTPSSTPSSNSSLSGSDP